MPITVKEVIAPPVERLRPQAERGGLSLAVDLPAELPRVLGDTERARQVVTNLVHNAIKFTPPGGHVHVSAARSANEVIISVHDTGVGIPEGLLPRIFERFFKADRARASVGTGLGLAIAKHIVQAHGGRIWAESVEGRGSTFRFSLLVAGKAGSAEADPDL
jgi:two-component system phosphate regulon sensor histidine kinase PhoR